MIRYILPISTNKPYISVCTCIYLHVYLCIRAYVYVQYCPVINLLYILSYLLACLFLLFIQKNDSLGKFTPGGFFGLCGGSTSHVIDPKDQAKAPQDIPKDTNTPYTNTAQQTPEAESSSKSQERGRSASDSQESFEGNVDTITQQTFDGNTSTSLTNNPNTSNTNSNQKMIIKRGITSDSMMYSDDEKKSDSGNEDTHTNNTNNTIDTNGSSGKGRNIRNMSRSREGDDRYDRCDYIYTYIEEGE